MGVAFVTLNEKETASENQYSSETVSFFLPLARLFLRFDSVESKDFCSKVDNY